MRRRPLLNVASIAPFVAAAAVIAPSTLALGAGSPGVATNGAPLDRLARIHALRAEATSEAPSFAYATLRELWSEWDAGDPAPVEDALSEVIADPHASAPIHVYAGLLAAYARRRRGDFDGARAKVASLGFVGRWLLAGPFDNEGKSGLDHAYGPEQDLGQPIDLMKKYDGKEHPVSFRMAPSTSAFGWVDTGTFVRPAEKACVYATTFVRDATLGSDATRPAEVWLGVAGAMKLFWNGTEVAKDDAYRDLDADRFGVPVTVRPGWNRLTLKACGDDDPPLFSLRIASKGGNVDESFEIDPDPSHGREAAAQRFRKLDPATAAIASGAARHSLLGPLVDFENHEKSKDPKWLEGFARYLTTTQGDDPSAHTARDLARRAAEAAPTVRRLLLAGDLAEGRNQRAVWIEKAADRVAKLGASPEDALRVLEAQAAHAREGVNRTESVQMYDKLLAYDPDDIPGNVARAELYAESGLKETATAHLALALERNPRSASLLRAYYDALRDLHRETEASAIEERLQDVRLDSADLAKSRIEEALSARDSKTALRWTNRLLAAIPDHPATLAFAAQVDEQVGDRPSAVAMYKRSLALAPDDTDAMRSLADLYAESGRSDESLHLLRRILELQPQNKEVREYVAHAGPSAPRADEAYARPSSEFLALRGAPAAGRDKRTFVDLQVTTVFPNGLASRFHQVVFQPLTEAAAEAAREYGFGFESDSEAVELRGARVYREGGRIDQAVESGESPTDDPDLATYSSASAFWVRFPRISPGDVVELLYRVEDVAPRNAFADYFGEVTYMQSAEPIAHAEYDLITPKSRTFYFGKPTVPGLVQTIKEDETTRTYRFTAEHVPALDPEVRQPPPTELLGHVHVSTYKTWDEMGAWYWGLAKDQLTVDDEVRRRTREVTKGLTTERDKVRAVYDYVVQKTRYVALEFGIHGFKPYRASQIFARGFGDCKDKATLIVAMLKELNIPASLVIVRTGMRGGFDEYPASLAIFDHAIAYVPSLNLYLDGTAEYSGSTELPGMDRNSLALVVGDGVTKPRLVHLPDPPASESVSTRVLDAKLGAHGDAEVDWTMNVSGVRASSWRQRFRAEGTRAARVAEDLGSELRGFKVDTVDASDLDRLEEPVHLHAHGTASDFARATGTSGSAGEVSAAVGPGEYLVREYASLGSRSLDVRLDARTTQTDEDVFHLPAGATVVRAPVASHGESPFGSYAIEVKNDGATVDVRTTVVISVTRIAAKDYPAFRKFSEETDRALGQRLVFVSK